MGVPGFFSWLLKNYKKNQIIVSNLSKPISTLYIDANCLFHPQCFKVLGHYGSKLDVDVLEDKMMSRILSYIDYLISYVNPTDLVYIAVDGIAPMAKMNQQRKRRYKSTIDIPIHNKIKEKHNKPVNTIWSNTVITPGTEFMERLHEKLINYVSKNSNKIKINYSSYHVVGEGEHKILQHIKSTENDKDIVIYGLDADLIFLSLASMKNNIYLLREDLFNTSDVDKEYDDISEILTYVSIEQVRNSINEHFRFILNVDDNKDYVNDFIMMCYFLGNDFIPSIPSIEIKNYGIDTLFDQYKYTFNKLGVKMLYTINNKVEINAKFLGEFLKNLSNLESYYFRVKQKAYIERLNTKICPYDDEYNKEMWHLENIKFDCGNLDLGNGEDSIWKYRYYSHYYGVSGTGKDHIDNMCHNYIEGIIWTSKYYFDKCISYNWQYSYVNCPFVSDLSEYFSKVNLNNITFKDEYKITPFVQLMSVLPSSCYKLLPIEYGKLMTHNNSPIIDLFPTGVKIDTLYKESDHKCIPLIPNIDIKRILDCTNNIKLSDKEVKRNLICNEII